MSLPHPQLHEQPGLELEDVLPPPPPPEDLQNAQHLAASAGSTSDSKDSKEDSFNSADEPGRPTWHAKPKADPALHEAGDADDDDEDLEVQAEQKMPERGRRLPQHMVLRQLTKPRIKGEVVPPAREVQARDENQQVNEAFKPLFQAKRARIVKWIYVVLLIVLPLLLYLDPVLTLGILSSLFAAKRLYLSLSHFFHGYKFLRSAGLLATFAGVGYAAFTYFTDISNYLGVNFLNTTLLSPLLGQIALSIFVAYTATLILKVFFKGLSQVFYGKTNPDKTHFKPSYFADNTRIFDLTEAEKQGDVCAPHSEDFHTFTHVFRSLRPQSFANQFFGQLPMLPDTVLKSAMDDELKKVRGGNYAAAVIRKRKDSYMPLAGPPGRYMHHQSNWSFREFHFLTKNGEVTPSEQRIGLIGQLQEGLTTTGNLKRVVVFDWIDSKFNHMLVPSLTVRHIRKERQAADHNPYKITFYNTQTYRKTEREAPDLDAAVNRDLDDLVIPAGRL